MRLQRRDGNGCGSRVDNVVPRAGLPTETDPAIAASSGPASPGRPIVQVTDAEACTLCGSCVDACMRDAISLNETIVIDARLCTGCGDCIEACPQDVLELVEA
jgi:ferredoxin